MRTFIPALALLAACGRGAPDAPPPAAARAAELVALVNSGSAPAARAYVERGYTDSLALSAPLAEQVARLAALHDRAPGLRVERVWHPAPGEARVRARSAVTDEPFDLRVVVEARPPHRIRSFHAEPGAQPVPSSDAARARALDAYLRVLAREDRFSGVVLVARGGRPFYTAAFGVADREAAQPVREDTRFNLASVGKMFTAVAVAQLAEAGKLSLDDPLSKFLPDYPDPPGAERIRIKHLLSHTSGLADVRWMDVTDTRWGSVEELLRRVGRPEVLAEPGTRFQYSNLGYVVLGRVIERASGQSFYDYLEEHVFRPAGMRSTGFPARDRLPAGAAVGYHPAGDAWTDNREEIPFRGAPFGCGYSTAGDLLRFTRALRGGRLLPPARVRELTTPRPELGSPHYGYGFGALPGGEAVGHGGGFKGISTELDLYRGGYTAIVLSNRTDGALAVATRVRALVLGRAP